jgi:hypothetical protein
MIKLRESSEWRKAIETNAWVNMTTLNEPQGITKFSQKSESTSNLRLKIEH